MLTLRLLGAALVIYGGVMLALLATPHRDWALDHSIAEVVSSTDRRVGNEVSGSVDEPIAIAGSAVLVFAGLWIGLLVPYVIGRSHRSAAQGAGWDDGTDASATSEP